MLYAFHRIRSHVNCVGDDGHGSDTLPLNVICLATIQALKWKSWILLLLSPCVVFIVRYHKKMELTWNAKEGDVKMSVDAKCPKVPHLWYKIGQRVGQLQTVWPFSSVVTVLFRYTVHGDCFVLFHAQGQKCHMYFQNSIEMITNCWLEIGCSKC